MKFSQATLDSIHQNPDKAGILGLPNGCDAFAARVLLSRGAEKTLMIQTYIWQKDSTGMILMDEVMKAADRGVLVQLLLDDNNTSAIDPLLKMLASHPNIELKLFNPFHQRNHRLLSYLMDFTRLNKRMHNKVFLVDGEIGIVGGRNIGDEYFDISAVSNFTDLDVVAVGNIVSEMTDAFKVYWQNALSHDSQKVLKKVTALSRQDFQKEHMSLITHPKHQAYVEEIQNSTLVTDMAVGSVKWEWCTTQLMIDSPDKKVSMAPSLKSFMENSKQELNLISPYYVPGKPGARALIKLVKKGVKVRLLTNSLAATDVIAVHAGYAKYRKKLLKGGVQIFEMKGTSKTPRFKYRKHLTHTGSRVSLHAKTFSSDFCQVFVGSYNLDPRSARLNTEMGLAFESEALAINMSQRFDYINSDVAYELKLDKFGMIRWHDDKIWTSEPDTRFLRRALVWIFSKLPIEWLL